MENKPVMGKITVEKTGNMLVGAKEIETIFGQQYPPIFEMGFLVGAEFDVVAAEDIIIPDGTIRAKKGDVVDRLVTGEDGQATSKELYLGEYELVETKAPKNYVLDPTPHPVSLFYADQAVAVVTSQIGIMNARHLVEIELLKRMEGFDKFERFEDVIFGLYTAQDIYAEDGKLIIAKDSLILMQDSLMALSALNKDGHGRFEGELPFAKYYVLELQTAEGFILDSTKYPVDASYTGEDNAVTRIKQVAALCLTAFLQTTLLFLGLLTFPDHMLLGMGIMLSSSEVPRIAQQFGLDTSAKFNLSSVVHMTSAVNLARHIGK